jgi:hypothetical protein
MGIPRERDLRGHYVQLLDFLAEDHGRYDLDRAWFDRLEPRFGQWGIRVYDPWI